MADLRAIEVRSIRARSRSAPPVHLVDAAEGVEHYQARQARLAEREDGLLRKRAHVVARLGSITLEAKSLVRAEREGRADASERLDILTAVSEALIARLRRIDAALDRVEAGVFGVCTQCGGLIDELRLDEMAEIESCLSCAWDAACRNEALHSRGGA